MTVLALTIEDHTEYLPQSDQEAAMQRYWAACGQGRCDPQARAR